MSEMLHLGYVGTINKQKQKKGYKLKKVIINVRPSRRKSDIKNGNESGLDLQNANLIANKNVNRGELYPFICSIHT